MYCWSLVGWGADESVTGLWHVDNWDIRDAAFALGVVERRSGQLPRPWRIVVVSVHVPPPLAQWPISRLLIHGAQEAEVDGVTHVRLLRLRLGCSPVRGTRHKP
eukprot:1752378-Prymnesium_polylepis.1